MRKVKISEIKPNPNNPRIIKDEKFKKLVQSLKDLPEMAEVRPIVVNTDMVVLGGNMRLKAMKEAGWKQVPAEVVDWPEEKQRQFIIKDNVDAYKIGKLNHFPKHEKQFDWTEFLNKSIYIMRKNNKQFYIKNDLAEFANDETILTKNERDMDYLAISNTFAKAELV